MYYVCTKNFRDRPIHTGDREVPRCHKKLRGTVAVDPNLIAQLYLKNQTGLRLGVSYLSLKLCHLRSLFGHFFPDMHQKGTLYRYFSVLMSGLRRKNGDQMITQCGYRIWLLITECGY